MRRRRTSEPHAAPHADPPNPIRALQTFGQSVWLDYLRRSLFTSGEFRRLIAEDGLRGATSNPSIFEKAIAGSTDYLNALQDIERRGDMEPMALYEALAIRDIRDAADLLRPVYDSTARADGYVSLEVSPYHRARHRGDDRRSEAPLEGRRPRERHDQGAGVHRGSARDS